MPRDTAESEVLTRLPRGAMLCRPELAKDISAHWFEPEWWQDAAQPVASGGRGTAWFIRHDTRDWVLRHYSRGGLVARFSQRSYGYAGADRVRSFTEFRLLNRLLHLGLPVPQPVAAWYERRGWFSYQAGIIVETLPQARPFADCLRRHNPDLWHRVGALIRRFHAVGLDHADLNCHNILVTPKGIYLIDFDKGVLRQTGPETAKWQQRNLQRLKRSLAKLPEPACFGASWQQLLAGYYGIPAEDIPLLYPDLSAV